MNEPEVKVGIVNASKIRFTLNGKYSAKGESVEGQEEVEYDEGGILWKGNIYQRLTFEPQADDASFSLFEVTIGKEFHWERKETQTFRGKLHFIVDEGQLCAINILPVEEYLESVISSEMKATASLEFLKAHAVISRSWLMAQIEKHQQMEQESRDAFFSYQKTDAELIRWYDREDHTLFDVCADDHCQRYQGITKATSEQVHQAVEATRGIVLYYQGEICDARFSKCCGGVSEEFGTCWENLDKPYLKALHDGTDEHDMPDLTIEENARQWILSSPDAFCNTQNKRILSQILNNYDQETDDFYRWVVQYTQEELTQLIAHNLKEDLGDIINLVPLARGKSGRIYRLQIVGTKKSFVIGKELEIRRVLSHSHLFSSAFVVDKNYDRFIIHGAGWGHGVGLCQIGAAVMGEQGYSYKQILQHYYPGSYLASSLLND
ncbi:MAG: SpoIID/LytB domain-containing protein [Bacteroidaceae bacterium]|nr:SpoIID/LytB domain-containing protein [Bacteroidaceae bacterium]